MLQSKVPDGRLSRLHVRPLSSVALSAILRISASLAVGRVAQEWTHHPVIGARFLPIADIGRRLPAVCEYLGVEELPERDAQALSDAVDVLDGDVVPAGLDFREARARHFYRMRERPLAHAKAVSELLDSESDAHWGSPQGFPGGHLLSWCRWPWVLFSWSRERISDPCMSRVM